MPTMTNQQTEGWDLGLFSALSYLLYVYKHSPSTHHCHANSPLDHRCWYDHYIFGSLRLHPLPLGYLRCRLCSCPRGSCWHLCRPLPPPSPRRSLLLHSCGSMALLSCSPHHQRMFLERQHEPAMQQPWLWSFLFRMRECPWLPHHPLHRLWPSRWSLHPYPLDRCWILVAHNLSLQKARVWRLCQPSCPRPCRKLQNVRTLNSYTVNTMYSNYCNYL